MVSVVPNVPFVEGGKMPIKNFEDLEICSGLNESNLSTDKRSKILKRFRPSGSNPARGCVDLVEHCRRI